MHACIAIMQTNVCSRRDKCYTVANTSTYTSTSEEVSYDIAS